MGVNDLISNSFTEAIRVPMLPNESVVKNGLGTWPMSHFKVITADIFLTNMRLVIQGSIKTAALASTVGSIGGGIGGGLSAAGGGILGGKNVLQNYENSVVALLLTDIVSATPSKYKTLGFIPSPVKGIDVVVLTGEKYTILIKNRDEWLYLLNSNKAVVEPINSTA